MYPLEVEINAKNILTLQNSYKRAYIQIIKEIQTATDFGVANRKAILAQIRAILEELGIDTQKFLEAELPQYYKAGAKDAVRQLKNVGAPIPITTGFNRIHKRAIIALVDDTSRAFGESLTGINRSAQLLLGRVNRELITQALAEGKITGKTLREVKEQIKGILAEQGLSALVDKGGHTWTLDRYSEMLFRTKAVEARNRGLTNRMVENGYDLVQVSNHNSEHEACRVWESKILSLRGITPGYETVADAEMAGLFHPNCKHAINAIIPSLARKTEAYNPDERTKRISEAEIERATNLAR